MCEQCESHERFEERRYLETILWLVRLQDGGFTFSPDDLDLNLWADLGIARTYLKQKDLQQLAAALWGGQGKPDEK